METVSIAPGSLTLKLERKFEHFLAFCLDFNKHYIERQEQKDFLRKWMEQRTLFGLHTPGPLQISPDPNYALN